MVITTWQSGVALQNGKGFWNYFLATSAQSRANNFVIWDCSAVCFMTRPVGCLVYRKSLGGWRFQRSIKWIIFLVIVKWKDAVQECFTIMGGGFYGAPEGHCLSNARPRNGNSCFETLHAQTASSETSTFRVWIKKWIKHGVGGLVK